MKILKKWKKIHLRSVRSVFTFKWEKLAYLIGADMSPSSHHSLGVHAPQFPVVAMARVLIALHLKGIVLDVVD